MRFEKLTFLPRLAIFCCALGLSSCLSLDDNGGGGLTTPPTLAGLAFFHCAPSAPSTAITMDGSPVTGGSLAFGTFSGYATVTPGSHKVKFSSVSDNSTVVDSSYTVQGLTSNTIFLYNVGGKTKTLQSLDASPGVSQDNAMFRFAHLSADTPDVKVFVAGQTKSIAEQIGFAEVAPFVGFLAQRLTVEVRAVSDNHVIISKVIDPLPAKYYTIVLVGSSNVGGGGANTLKLLLGESN